MQDHSSKLGSSSSPVMNRVLQQPAGTNCSTTTAQAALADKHTDKPVPVK